MLSRGSSLTYFSGVCDKSVMSERRRLDLPAGAFVQAGEALFEVDLASPWSCVMSGFQVYSILICPLVLGVDGARGACDLEDEALVVCSCI